jgi:hypothetical protein
MDRGHVDSFENAVLQRRQHGDPDAVLAALRRHPAISTFEGTETLMHSVRRLIADGKIREVPAGYPWHRYEVLDLGP